MNNQLIKVEEGEGEAGDWNDQLKEIADNEEWENFASTIPLFLQDRFSEQFTRFGPGELQSYCCCSYVNIQA
jgi:hypothetical protein